MQFEVFLRRHTQVSLRVEAHCFACLLESLAPVADKVNMVLMSDLVDESPAAYSLPEQIEAFVRHVKDLDGVDTAEPAHALAPVTHLMQ